MSFLDGNNILCNEQFGFRKNRSTYMAGLDVIDFITSGFNNKELTLGIFVDLSKAFDTVNHNILLQKLYHYGIRGMALNLLKSYLACRKQLVVVDGHTSQSLAISCGVPQGSILGPLLFLLYINDLPYCTRRLKFCLFADDTSILFKSNDLFSSECMINSDLCIISRWFQANKLSLNVDKN